MNYSYISLKVSIISSLSGMIFPSQSSQLVQNKKKKKMGQKENQKANLSFTKINSQPRKVLKKAHMVDYENIKKEKPETLAIRATSFQNLQITLVMFKKKNKKRESSSSIESLKMEKVYKQCCFSGQFRN